MNVLDLLRERGIEPKYMSSAKGGEYASPCPGCGGEDRFRIWPEQNGGSGSWWCREGSGCGKGGDNIEFLREYCGMDFREACDKVGREPDRSPIRCSQPRRKVEFQPKQHEAPTEVWRRKSGELVDWAHSKLLGNHEQLDYLAGRGIPLEAVRRFKLGWNPGEKGRDLFRARSAWALPEENNHKTGKPKRLWMPVGMVIPFFWKGVLQRVRFRRTPEAMAQWGKDKKYIVMPGSAMGPMLTRETAQAWMIVEAELDGVAMDHAAGDLNVGTIALGMLSGKPDDRAWTRLKSALWIGNALDFELFTPETEEDERTLKQQTKSKQWWKNAFPQCERWPVPLGKDPGDYVKDHGGDLHEWIKEGLPPRLRIGRSMPVSTSRGGGATSSPRPQLEERVQLPETISALRTLLMTNRMELFVSLPSGRIFGGEMDADVAAKVGDFVERRVVQEWLAQIGDEVVTHRNFMKPLEAKNG